MTGTRHLSRLVGESAAFRHALSLIRKLAVCDATVFLQGETGTGKELAARAIHYSSARRDEPFLAVNCGAIAEGLIESELFGAERGAFTDAKEARAGLVSQARGGTLLLDEVDALSPKAQVVLLRFLEDREYRPVGGRNRHADVRIISASNCGLQEQVERGTFRQDLMFRLNLVSLELPPLRRRGYDVILLARCFLRRYAQEYGQALRTLHEDTVAAFLSHDWPGNVRELQNLIHRQILISDEPVVRIDDPGAVYRQCTRSAPRTVAATGDFNAARARAIAQFERSYLTTLLRTTNGNVSHAARIAGKERSALGKLIKKHGLKRADFQRASGHS